METVRSCVSVEGNIGAGKSEFLRLLSRMGFEVRPEPVDRWRPLLDQVYNAGLGAVALQARVTLDSGVPPGPMTFVERDPRFQLNVFVRAALDAGTVNLHEAVVLHDLHERVVRWQPSGLLYLRCRPETCLERIRRRGRVEEVGLTMSGVRSLHELYEAAFAAAPEPKSLLDVSDKSPREVVDAAWPIIQRLLPIGQP